MLLAFWSMSSSLYIGKWGHHKLTLYSFLGFVYVRCVYTHMHVHTLAIKFILV